MVFLINANLGPEAAQPLLVAGHQVVYAREQYPDASDAFLRQEAARNGWVVVTQDKGFSQATREQPLSAGLITLRLRKQSEENAADALSAFLRQEDPSNLRNRSVIVGDGGTIRG